MSGLCEHCIQGHTLPGTPGGSIQDSAYFHPGPKDSKRAIVLLSDIFGLNLVNSKLIADEYSRRLECDVWCPDMFAGSPPVAESQLGPLLADTPGVGTSLGSKLKLLWVIILGLPAFIRSRPSVVTSRVIAFTKKIREEKGYEKVGVVGFCFGGAIVVRLGSAGIFDSAVVVHPGSVSRAQIEAITIPTSWVCAEEDFTFGTKIRSDAEAILKRKRDEDNGAQYEFRDYKGTTHGFAARPNLGLPVVKQAFEDAVDQGVKWLDQTLN